MNNKMKKRTIKILIALVIYIIAIVGNFGNIWIKDELFIISYLIVGFSILKKAIRNIFRGKVFDENFLMAVATIGAFGVGEFPEAVAVMLFYQIGELFQSYAVDKSRKSISSLMDIRPDYANVIRNNKEEKVDPDDVKIGELIVVKPGEKIPLDGIIAEGTTMLDTKALTGESVPVEVKVNDEVLSGSINESGKILVKVSKEYGESTVSKILDLVENASSKKSKSENIKTAETVELLVGTDLKENITGGYSYKQYETNSYDYCQFVNNTIRFAASGSGNRAIYSTNKKIDISTTSTLIFDIYADTNYSGEMKIQMDGGVSNTNQADYAYAKNSSVSGTTTIPRQEITVDVSDLKGEYFIKSVIYHGTNVSYYGAFGYIYKITMK